MDDNERKGVFDRLVAILRQNRLDWIVDQVTEQIHLGRTIFKEVDTVKRIEVHETTSVRMDADFLTPGLKRGSKAQFPATADYDDKEKVILMLQGIIEATNAIEMENEFLKSLSMFGGFTEVVFYSEQLGATDRIASSSEAAARAQQLSRIRDSISRLRQEAETD